MICLSSLHRGPLIFISLNCLFPTLTKSKLSGFLHPWSPPYRPWVAGCHQVVFNCSYYIIPTSDLGKKSTLAILVAKVRVLNETKSIQITQNPHTLPFDYVVLGSYYRHLQYREKDPRVHFTPDLLAPKTKPAAKQIFVSWMNFQPGPGQTYSNSLHFSAKLIIEMHSCLRQFLFAKIPRHKNNVITVAKSDTTTINYLIKIACYIGRKHNYKLRTIFVKFVLKIQIQLSFIEWIVLNLNRGKAAVNWSIFGRNPFTTNLIIDIAWHWFASVSDLNRN